MRGKQKGEEGWAAPSLLPPNGATVISLNTEKEEEEEDDERKTEQENKANHREKGERK